MLLLERLAETRIAEAMARGEFDGLRGAGRPLALDDDRDVPPELRVAWRVLRNAGYVPPQVIARREAMTLEALLRRATDVETRSRIARRMQVLRLRLEADRGASPAPVWADYGARLHGHASDE